MLASVMGLRSRRALPPFAVVVAVALAPPAVRADGDELASLHEPSYAETLASKWRKGGMAAFPHVMEALCSRGTSAREAADLVLAEWGPAAVDRLFDEVGKGAAGGTAEVRCSSAAER